MSKSDPARPVSTRVKPSQDGLRVRVRGGQVEAIYDDRLRGVLRRGTVFHVQRASHVEPTEEGAWVADLAPVGGPVLGPFSRRSEALHAEREWLREERGL